MAPIIDQVAHFYPTSCHYTMFFLLTIFIIRHTICMNRIWDSDETCEAVASIYSWRPSPLQTTAEAITKCIENSISSSSDYIFNQPLDHNFPDPLICNSRALIYQNIKIHSGICTNTYIYIYLAIYKYIYLQYGLALSIFARLHAGVGGVGVGPTAGDIMRGLASQWGRHRFRCSRISRNLWRKSEI